MRDRTRARDEDDWPNNDDQPEPLEWAHWQVEGGMEPVMNCNDGCELGYDCPCYEEGSRDGERDAENNYPDTEAEVTNALEEARKGIEQLFNKILMPIENAAFLKGNEKALVEADKLREMQRDIEEILGN